MTTTCHCCGVKSHSKGYRYVGRPTIYGNPFIIGPDGDRKEVCQKHRVWLNTGENFGNRNATAQLRFQVLKGLKDLKGNRLGCWCKPQECHADYLAELAELK